MAVRHIPWPVGTVLALPLLAALGEGSTVGDAYAVPTTTQDTEEGAGRSVCGTWFTDGGPRAGKPPATDGH
ncbi:hypothetical protein J2853_005606 [Streptosporangium lutulentum]|uniref:Secreted protein n=1 Tax=Streptosporangium lutulentum TaxID=1461250 RepID=A0ABT9QJ57_9ACTN|nr:hypothetical protein [Streptosporangium lutulentum]